MEEGMVTTMIMGITTSQNPRKGMNQDSKTWSVKV
jgi:phage-related protein